jgi:catechol 2,3-dioxygenase-like lactoylglutathione lyase family enzyme
VPSLLHELCFDARDPEGLARFWSEVLGRELVEDPSDGPVLLPDDESGFRIRFLPTEAEKSGPNQMHFDLASQTLEEQQATVTRALDLGARHLDVGQGPDAEHVVLADPEGNEFCVIEPGNTFLDGCGLVGCLSSDGSRAVGHFWAEALGWPLVWDQDEETAIQSPRGGSKISWGGPPFAPKHGKNRLHFDLLPADDAFVEAERLVSLGASRVDMGQGDVTRVSMADPDGNEFCVVRTP